jgi:hypothetical protein
LKYRFAIGADNSTFDILDIDVETRRLGSPYKCFGCSGELIPNIPKTDRTKYFSHKAEQSCNRESYLHKLAKYTFFENYKKALASGIPFVFSFEQKFLCSAFHDTFGIDCEGIKTKDFDLTKVYKEITLEERHGAFVPDIALLSEKHAPLFVEMMVSHGASYEKIASGAKIVEIAICEEKDINAFRDMKISDDGSNVRTYGLKIKTLRADACPIKCKKDVELFTVSADGAAKFMLKPLKYFAQRIDKYRVLSVPVVPESNESDRYKVLVANLRHHLFNGVQIKNCLVCDHQRMGKFDGIWCNAKTVKIVASDALTCQIYKPFKSGFEAEVAESLVLLEYREHWNAVATESLNLYPRKKH